MGDRGLVLVGFTRIQGLGLVGAYLLAILVFALTGEPSRRSAYLRRFRPTVAMLVAALSAPVLGSIARGDGAFGWLGARSA